MNFSDYKSRSNDILLAEVDKVTSKNKGNFDDDNRFWYPTKDKAGNGNAIIRFLDAHPDEDVPFVQYHEHNFQGPTGLVFREYCSKDVGSRCPVCESVSALFKSKEGERQARDGGLIRRHIFVSNILVLKNPANPEQEGKVFLYRYGKQIFNKINEMMHPDQSLGEKEPINPFHLVNGANFVLRIRMVDKFPSYVTSTFSEPSALVKSEKDFDRIVKQLYPLQPFVAPELYKDYDTLKARFDKVMGLDGTPVKEAAVAVPGGGGIGGKPSATASDDDDLLVDDSTNDADTAFFRNLASTS